MKTKNNNYSTFIKMMAENNNQADANCVRFAVENDMLSFLSRHAPSLLTQKAFFKTLDYPFTELEMSFIINRGGTKLPQGFVERFFKIATLEHAVFAVCAYPAFFKYLDLRFCKSFNSKTWAYLLLTRISKNKKRVLSHFLRKLSRIMLCKILAYNPILYIDLKRYAGFVPTNSEWGFIISLEPDITKLNECQKAIDSFTRDEWIKALEKSEAMLVEASNRGLTSSLSLKNWKALLMDTKVLDFYAFKNGIFKLFSPEDFVELLKVNEYREVYYDMTKLTSTHWKNLMIYAPNLFNMFVKYDAINLLTESDRAEILTYLNQEI